jgi:hypothetical protein
MMRAPIFICGFADRLSSEGDAVAAQIGINRVISTFAGKSEFRQILRMNNSSN